VSETGDNSIFAPGCIFTDYTFVRGIVNFNGDLGQNYPVSYYIIQTLILSLSFSEDETIVINIPAFLPNSDSFIHLFITNKYTWDRPR